MHVLKAGFPDGGALERWWDHKGFNSINGLIHWWVSGWMGSEDEFMDEISTLKIQLPLNGTTSCGTSFQWASEDILYPVWDRPWEVHTCCFNYNILTTRCLVGPMSVKFLSLSCVCVRVHTCTRVHMSMWMLKVSPSRCFSGFSHLRFSFCFWDGVSYWLGAYQLS